MSALSVDIVFDTVCPWCFIGSRRFRRALEMRPEIDVDIRWRPFLLNPDLPPAGMERERYLIRKLGSSYRVERVLSAALEAGASEDIDFNFSAIKTMPNSMESHRLIQWANGTERQADLVDAIFCAFFLEGRNIGDRETLADVAEAAGYSRAEAKDWLENSRDSRDVGDANLRMRRWGVTGVPCFVFGEQYAMPGALEPDLMAAMLSIACEIMPTQPSSSVFPIL